MGIICCYSPVFANDNILIYGKTFSESKALHSALEEKGFRSESLTLEGIQNVSIHQGRLLILAADAQFQPEIRKGIDNYLRTGGNVIIAGAKGFDYAPVPCNPVSIVDFDDQKTYKIIRQERKVKSGSLEKEKIRIITVDGNKRALEFSTQDRGMHDVMVEIPVKEKCSSSNSVITFRAKGNSYMDLLSMEIIDAHGCKWYNFTSITSEWKEYAVSLADFIPENWKDKNGSYPLLNPDKIETLLLGVNLMTIWKEKGMYLAISNVSLAKNKGIYFTPTSALKTMEVPFLENGITLPQWLFDPMFQGKPIMGKRTLTGEGYCFGKKKIENVDSIFCLPETLVIQPGTRMGTDHPKSYDHRDERETRIIPILKADGKDGRSPDIVAKLDIYTGGRYKGASACLFGIHPKEVISDSIILKTLIETAFSIMKTPAVAAVKINTTAAEKSSVNIVPTLKVTLKNPLSEPIKGKVLVNIADGKLKGEMDVFLPSCGLLVEEIKLQQVPYDFQFQKFNWKISFVSNKGNDVLQDSVDVERSLLIAFRQMVNAQKEYPDGRISHHYFGDAYGIRAMFAYLHYIKQHPEHFQLNRDIWKTISPDEIERCAFRFCDMLVERQTPEGALPMGYSENSRGFNVADGGQISLSLAQSSPFVPDLKRRESYLNVAYRFAHWAEEFYIDSLKSAKLAISEPKEYRKGNAFAGMYGLGQYGDYRKPTGFSWVGADILAVQIYLANIDSSLYSKDLQVITKRNIDYYVNASYSASGYYQAEALIWAWLASKDASIRFKIERTLKTTFIQNLMNGVEDDMFERGSRCTLNALPLLYYQRYIEDNASIRAVLLKYIWTFGSESSCNGIDRLSKAFPKPVHGESLSAIKYAALSSLWSMELIDPESTLFPKKIKHKK